MDNEAPTWASPLPTLELPGWELHQRIARPAIGGWPAHEQWLLLPSKATSDKRLLRIDLFEAAGEGQVERVMTFLRSESNARDAAQVQPVRDADGAWHWHWGGLWMVGRAGLVVQLRNAGAETMALGELAKAVDEWMRKRAGANPEA